MSKQQAFLELAAQFASTVIAQNEAMKRGDVSQGNQFALRRVPLAEKLITGGDAGLSAFATLLVHDRADVRGMAAAYLIPYKTIESKHVLESLAKELDSVGLGAMMALKRWEVEGKGIDLS